MKSKQKGSKETMRRWGFMCRSMEATEVCITDDSLHPVIVPRRRHNTRTLIEDGSLSTRLIPTGSSLHSKSEPFIAGAQRIVAKRPLMRDFNGRDQNISAKVAVQHQEPMPRALQATTSTLSNDNVFRVVVMRVSIHCHGCAGKVKKHLSKMEGVTSFSIDVETKMVTVMGHVSPARVLESVSKVKRAEFWPS